MVIEQQYVTPKEAARILGRSVRTVLRALAAGELPGTRFGEDGHWNIPIAAVEAHAKMVQTRRSDAE